MAPTFPVNTLNIALDAVGDAGRWISLHTGDPSNTGANEVPTSGGSPNYARKQTTWGNAAAGVMTGQAQTLDVPPSTTIAYFGVWTAATGGTYIGGGPLRNTANTANITESFTGQGQFAITPRLTADTVTL